MEKTYYESGSVRSEVTVKDLDWISVYKEYYEDGKLKGEIYPEHERGDAFGRRYHRNGKIAQVILSAAEARDDSHYKSYDEAGNEISKAEFEQRFKF